MVFTVTDLTKMINGIETRVILDQDLRVNESGDEELSEEELAFFAQDDDHNVWSMGEYPEEIDEDTEEN